MSECFFEFIKLDLCQDGEQIIVPQKEKKKLTNTEPGFLQSNVLRVTKG